MCIRDRDRDLERNMFFWFAATGPSQAFWMCCVCWQGFGELARPVHNVSVDATDWSPCIQMLSGIWIAGAGVWMQLKPNRQKVPASQHSVFPDHHLRSVMRLGASDHCWCLHLEWWWGLSTRCHQTVLAMGCRYTVRSWADTAALVLPDCS